MKQVRQRQDRALPSAPDERDTVLREVEQILALARSVSLGPQFDDILKRAVEQATDRLVAATRRRTARLAALSAIQQTVAQGFDLPVIMAGVYTHLRDILDAPFFAVAAYDASTDSLTPSFVVSDGKVQPAASLGARQLPAGPARAVLTTGEPRIAADGAAAMGMAGGMALRSVMLAPLLRGDDVVGVMMAGSGGPDAYGPEEVDLLATVANQAGMAMENARLYDEALRHSREVETLLAAAQELGADLEPDRVLGRILASAAHLVGARAATVGVAARGGLRFDRVWEEGEWRDLGLVLPAELAFPECARGEAILTNNPPVSGAGALGPHLPPLRGLLAVPVTGGEGRLLGVIALMNGRDGSGFTSRDLELSAAFASHAALAIERARTFRAVEQSRNYLQTVMDRSYAAIFVLDPATGRIHEINAAGLRLLGRERTDVLGRSIADLGPGDARPEWDVILRDTPENGTALTCSPFIVGADNVAIPLEATATRLDHEGVQTLVLLCRDRRPSLRRQEEERLRALGEMASGVAHDFNNMLGVILGRTEVMTARGASSAGDLAVLKQAALDGAETVKRLQTFSGVAKPAAAEAADVAPALREAVEFTRPRWRDAAHSHGITIDVVVDAGVTPPVAGSAAELREVLVNLIFNAVDAMPRGGRLTLRSFALAEGVRITVADTGTGMSDEVRARIFDPFFTTKGNRGTGLGLSASYGIISRLGGTIAVESAPERGSVFTIALPPGQAVPAAPPAPVQPPSPRALLLVDDEPQMLRTTKLMLEIEGHRVVAVESGRAALAALERERFDALLTDLGMPEINGVQLAEQVRSRNPDLPVLLITGWGLEVDAEAMAASGITSVLPKPFDIGQLRARLAAILPARAAEAREHGLVAV